MRNYRCSCLISFALFLQVFLVVLLTDWYHLTVVFAPGVLLDALVFPQGIEGNWPVGYLVRAMVIDTFVFAWVVILTWRIARYFEQQSSSKRRNNSALLRYPLHYHAEALPILSGAHHPRYSR